MKTVIERTGTSLNVSGMTATLPDNVSVLSVLGNNSFIPNCDYRNDGYVYLNEKPIKKWFQRIENVLIWEPILEDVKKLQQRYEAVRKVYHDYWKNCDLPAFKAVIKAKKAHAKITHKFTGTDDPWWLYEVSDIGPDLKNCISWDWVKEPKNPVNLKIGNRYYHTSQRLEELGKRVYKFKAVLHLAIYRKIQDEKGTYGQLLHVKVNKAEYWFQYGQYTWSLFATSENNMKQKEL